MSDFNATIPFLKKEVVQEILSKLNSKSMFYHMEAVDLNSVIVQVFDDPFASFGAARMDRNPRQDTLSLLGTLYMTGQGNSVYIQVRPTGDTASLSTSKDMIDGVLDNKNLHNAGMYLDPLVQRLKKLGELNEKRRAQQA